MIHMICMINSDHDAPVAQLVQTTKDGRRRYTAEQKQAVLELFHRSGMSGKAFALSHGIKYPTFALWRKQHREQQAKADQAGGFVLAELPSAVSARPSEDVRLVLELPNGSKVIAKGAGASESLAELINKLG